MLDLFSRETLQTPIEIGGRTYLRNVALERMFSWDALRILVGHRLVNLVETLARSKAQLRDGF